MKLRYRIAERFPRATRPITRFWYHTLNDPSFDFWKADYSDWPEWRDNRPTQWQIEIKVASFEFTFGMDRHREGCHCSSSGCEEYWKYH